MPIRHVRPILAASTLALAVGAAPAASAATPHASSFNGSPAVGALFDNPTGSGSHICTASVVASATHNTILTAAHCLGGNGTSFSFAPGYNGGAKPYGTWRVTRAYVDPRWKATQNPAYDAAVLTVADRQIRGHRHSIQDITGAYPLHGAPVAGSTVQVPAYNAGSGDSPETCTARVFVSRGYPGFTCDGYDLGVSGSPFLQSIGGARYVSGVIGGPNQGGCTSWTSYSSPFGPAQRTLIHRAEVGAYGDDVPWAGDDGC